MVVALCGAAPLLCIGWALQIVSVFLDGVSTLPFMAVEKILDWGEHKIE